MEVKRAAHEASEGLHDLAAEVTAEVVAAQLAGGQATATVPAQSDGQRTAPEPAADAPAAEAKAPAKGRTAGGGAAKAR